MFAALWWICIFVNAAKWSTKWDNKFKINQNATSFINEGKWNIKIKYVSYVIILSNGQSSSIYFFLNISILEKKTISSSGKYIRERHVIINSNITMSWKNLKKEIIINS